MEIGYAVVAGVRVPIVECDLRDSKVWFIAQVRGPLPAASGPVTIFGADGRGICQGGETSWKRLTRSDFLTLSIEMIMGECL
jgi:hypothetical protein